MGRIKTAAELALEKTEGMQFDEEKIRTDSLIRNGMTLAGRYLSTSDMTVKDLEKALSDVAQDDKMLFRKGVAEVVISNIVLPQDELYAMRFDRLADLAAVLNSKGGETLRQLRAFLDNYLLEKENFIKSIQSQLQDAMKQNPENMNPERLSSIIQQNLKRLDAQYQETLDRTKENLKKDLV